MLITKNTFSPPRLGERGVEAECFFIVKDVFWQIFFVYVHFFSKIRLFRSKNSLKFVCIFHTSYDRKNAGPFTLVLKVGQNPVNKKI